MRPSASPSGDPSSSRTSAPSCQTGRPKWRPRAASAPALADLGTGRGQDPSRRALPPSWFVLLTIAGLIAAVGIFTNSQILIVGAMVVGPEYAAIISVALGINKRDRNRIRAGVAALFFGFLIAIVVTFAFSVVVRAWVWNPTAFRLGVRPVSNLINTRTSSRSWSRRWPGSSASCRSSRPGPAPSSASSSRSRRSPRPPTSAFRAPSRTGAKHRLPHPAAVERRDPHGGGRGRAGRATTRLAARRQSARSEPSPERVESRSSRVRAGSVTAQVTSKAPNRHETVADLGLRNTGNLGSNPPSFSFWDLGRRPANQVDAQRRDGVLVAGPSARHGDRFLLEVEVAVRRVGGRFIERVRFNGRLRAHHRPSASPRANRLNRMTSR